MVEVSALIAAYNEENTIAKTITALWQIPALNEIIVVDDGSRDETASRAAQAGAKVVTLARNGGKGRALNSGATFITGEIVLLIDADLGESALKAERLIAEILPGEADVVIASFPAASVKSGFGLVKKLARWGVYWSCGVKYEAVLSGQRAMTREAFKSALPFSFGYSLEVASTIKLTKLGFKLKEVKVEMTHRITGRDLHGFCHRGKQFWHILKYFLLGGHLNVN